MRFPPADLYPGTQHALVFVDFPNDVGQDWLTFVDQTFVTFGRTAVEAIARLKDQKSFGSYPRVRPRICKLLQDARQQDVPITVEVGGSSKRKQLAYYYQGLEISLTTIPNLRHVHAAADDTCVASLDSMALNVSKRLSDVVGPSYGFAFDFPREFGVAYYLSAVGSIPAGRALFEFDTYTQRITRWRDRRWLGFRERNGYLREVYPINYLLDAHLRAPFRGGRLREYLNDTGKLDHSEFHPDVYQWSVSPSRIEEVRRELEDSGLVLSAPKEPVPNLS